MCWPRDQRRHPGAVIAVAILLAGFALLASPPPARANPACAVAGGPVGVISGAIGLGNPAGDVCNAVSGAVEAPFKHAISGALKGVSSDVFKQLTAWVSEGAGWLMGQVITAIDESTTPRLDTEGFLAAYGKMSAIAAVTAAAMVLLAILEGIAQGNPALLGRVLFVNVPVAFIGTSVAFAVVQLLLGVTDGLSAAMTGASHHGSTHFFEAAIGDLGEVGGEAGKSIEPGNSLDPGAAQDAGTVGLPLFVGFLAAIVGAFAAFFVWLELLLRDASIYAVSLFMPLALAASIRPRWNGALRWLGDRLVTVIGSKFVIVAIASLAASLIGEEGSSFEHILGATALMVLACFAPFELLRLLSYSQEAFAAAYGRRSATGGVVGAMQVATNVQMLRGGMGRAGGGSGVSLWEAGGGGSSAGGGGGSGGGGPGPGPRPGQGKEQAAGDHVLGSPVSGSGGKSGAGRSGAGGAGAAAEGAAGAVAVPVATATRGARGAAGQASKSAVQTGAAGGEAGGSQPAPSQQSSGSGDQSSSTGAGAPQVKRPAPQPDPGTSASEGSSSAPGARPPRPTPQAPSGPPRDGEPGGDGS